MLWAKTLSLLPLLWAFLATLLWQGQLKAPMLFLVVALLIGFGAQIVASFLWALWQATNNQFISVPATEGPRHLASITAFKAVATVVIIAPIYWLLRKRL